MNQPSDENIRRVAKTCAQSVRRTFADHVPLYACAVLFALTTVGVVTTYKLPFPLGSAVFFLSTIGEAIVLVAAASALKSLYSLYRGERPKNPLTFMTQRLLRGAIAGDRFGNMFHGLITFTPLMMIFAALKIDIAHIHPFSWDAAFMHIGVTMGFGRPLWEILQPVLGYPLITTMLSFAYGIWFLTMFGCLFWQLSSAHSDTTRLQFLLAFALAWFFGGFVLATVFSSAGPCFYSHFVSGPNPYAPLLQYLRETRQHWPVWTVDAQDDLWRAYLTGVGDIQGISAMPSMHVTIATLIALLGWRANRWLGAVFSVFAVVILISSIMLGWHYSADGFVGAGLAVIFWRTAGKITMRWEAWRARPQLGAVPTGAILQEG
jgi:membrane-associated phospholipid phosphatase